MTGLGEGTFLSQGGQKEASSLANGSKGAERCKGGVLEVDPKSSEDPKGSSEGHFLFKSSRNVLPGNHSPRGSYDLLGVVPQTSLIPVSLTHLLSTP